MEVREADAQRWDDVVAVMGTKGDPSRCRCQFFRETNAMAKGSSIGPRRDALCAQVAADVCGSGIASRA